jgi:hypothetical protein
LQVEEPSVMLVQISRECTPSYLSTEISNLLQLAQAEVVLGQLFTYLASWVYSYIVNSVTPPGKTKHAFTAFTVRKLTAFKSTE